MEPFPSYLRHNGNIDWKEMQNELSMRIINNCFQKQVSSAILTFKASVVKFVDAQHIHL